MQGDEKTITTNIAAQIRESLANIRLTTTTMTTATAALNDTVRDRKLKVETKSASAGGPREYIYSAASPTNSQPGHSP